MIYPMIIPNRIEADERIPLVKCLRRMMENNTAKPISRLVSEPKSLLLLPPPNELTPTLIRDRPIAVTTVPVTTLGKKRRRGLSRNPRTISKRPPIMQAPRIAPYPITPPPIDAAAPLKTPMNPELVPITQGSLAPTGPMVHICTSVTIPATSIAFWMTGTISPASPSEQAPPTTRIGVRLPTNIARTCCIPRMIARPRGMRPSSSYSEVITLRLFFFFLFVSAFAIPVTLPSHI